MVGFFFSNNLTRLLINNSLRILRRKIKNSDIKLRGYMITTYGGLDVMLVNNAAIQFRGAAITSFTK